ncbi:MAG: type II secretion system protein [Bacilli bacterium]|nr:type II secretion system protein [Bacilli bacterium]MDD4734050.1 type II secretion system protein [Bacilli bacterium]
MSKKGFTLIELLAIIVILAVIALIATPRITDAINEAREKEYKIQENYISKAAMNFVAVNREYIPDSTGQINVVKLSTLQTSNMIGDVFDPRNSSQKCDGYVYVKKGDKVDVETQSFLKCENNYVTDDYSITPLSIVEVLIVAGGGSGGTSRGGSGGGGGGGAGGVIYNTNYQLSSSLVDLKVGAGGLSRTKFYEYGMNGEDSYFDLLTALGGGGGGMSGGPGLVGGSGGGAGYNGYKYRAGTEGTPNQGYKGGDVLYNNNGAGGGGAGGNGGNTTDTAGVAGGVAGAGGLGLTFSVSGENITYATGGGGGGNGQTCGKPGLNNTGNGGNGVYAAYCASSGSGGSGIIIVRYPGIQKANGGTITSIDGYTIHTYTEVGNHVFQVLEF